jgi:hypothetical protein
MKRIAILTIITAAGLAGACASSPETTNKATNTVAANTTLNTAANVAPKTDEETPASVKAAFPDAQTFTKQHKDLTDAQIASIEKDTSSKVPDKDHHSYLAFTTTGGTRKQLGAATVIKADGKDYVIIYENKEGSPLIKEVRGSDGGDAIPSPFLKQFVGKGHDNDLLLGADIKANGANEAQAKTITEAIRVDVLTMQALYGAAHKH